MEIVVGTAGHIDHGKTALVRALTGTDADRLPEEKQRGITIDIGFAELTSGEDHFAFIDVPGHERFVKNMLAGATGIDIVMLVIAADEGVMPQTREHFEICRLLGLGAGMVVLTKTDLADTETLELARLEAEELVAGSFLEGSPIIETSSVTGKGFEEVKRALDSIAKRIPERRDRHVPFLPIDRSFALRGFGTVVTGTLSGAELVTGSDVEILPQRRRVRIRGLQTHGRQVDRATPGQRVAVNLAGIDHDEVSRGMAIAPPSRLQPTQMFDARVEALGDIKKPLRSRQRVRVHIETAEVLARLVVLEADGEIPQGGSGLVQVRLESPVAGLMNQRFVIRSYSPQATIAGGEVLLPHAHKIKRAGHARHREFLSRLMQGRDDPAETVRAFLGSVGEPGMERVELAQQTGWREDILIESIANLVTQKAVIEVGPVLMSRESFDELSERAVAAVEAFHGQEPLAAGISREALRDVVGKRLSLPVMNGVIERLAADGRLAAEGDVVRLRSHSIELSGDEERARDAIVAVYREAGLGPAKLQDALAEAGRRSGVTSEKARGVFALAVKSGEIVKVTEEFYFASTVVEDLKAKLKQFAEESEDRLIDVPRFKDIAGISRKYAIPLLEYFDRERVTVRVGDKRQIL